MAKRSKLTLCPYCGEIQKPAQRCCGCGGLMDDHSRVATQLAMGAWYVRDNDKPFHPGCNYQTLKQWVLSGRIERRTPIRGPSTHQFWEAAKRVRGVAHLLGNCHACRGKVKPEDTRCGHCDASFLIDDERNGLGLKYATQADVNLAKEQLKHHRSQSKAKGDAPQESVNLLEQVLTAPAPGRIDPPAKEAAPQQPPVIEDELPQPFDHEKPTADLATSRGTSFWVVRILVGLNIVVLILLVLYFTKVF